MSKAELTPNEVLASYKRSHLQCRVDRHRWSRKAFYVQESRYFVPGFSRRYQTCPDCGMQRWKEINIRTSEYTGRYGYLPPAGYYTPRTGLTLGDFSERLYEEDYADAVKDGRVTELREPAEDTPDPAPKLEVVPEPAQKRSRAKKAS